MKTGKKEIVKIRKGTVDVGTIMMGRHRIFGDGSQQLYDYSVRNNTITLYKAPYTVNGGVITIQ